MACLFFDADGIQGPQRDSIGCERFTCHYSGENAHGAREGTPRVPLQSVAQGLTGREDHRSKLGPVREAGHHPGEQTCLSAIIISITGLLFR